ncbi:MAG: hypothetical protein EAZ60_05525 [Oscillatoriales cyanobacterium]|nr:MAG: hypothetical protein EAZ83_00050 [Oscillatoriales cyanobacterium]TAF01287.1 MAG: hypothetical protein EAZ79_00415 [Oscillatoriales cyanobacterium]TAF12507.1 MAG: hypothetical protein EAZ73_31725 [Oscillatoriales cyanobacterium]TAF31875.1 MAG: hypothetical protein EAZ69_18750 [Oscillatoriales cyanobacterium]TAF57937.1 MAG: hypothetical protein EAZ60_05525 [Oscillatoriales cyanobacterium]
MNLESLHQHTHPKRLKEFLRENSISDFEAMRVMRPKFTIFWRYICKSLMQALERLVKAINASYPVGIDVLSQLFSLIEALNTVKPKVEVVEVYAPRDPPKPYNCLPKVEIGGCARSDLLVRSLIF